MSEFAENIKRAAGLLREAQQIMSSGPLDYYLAKLAEHSEALMTRFAPIKAGEKAVIVTHIECKDGWAGSDKTLGIGRQGVIQEVDYYKGKFVFQFVPDEQWWKDDKGEYRECERKSSYCLSETQLVKVVS